MMRPPLSSLLQQGRAVGRIMAGQPTRCYYEVLNVERKATYDEIRAAYKKQALLCHPDKNHGNVEEAAATFKEVQNAYAVLSDSTEREWYDAHRESILSGDNDGTCAPDEINLYEYFAAKCFSGYGDGEDSFFSVYRKVFDALIDEESSYDERARSWPRFGDSQTPYHNVSKFYIHWKNFNSHKTFAWKDEYKINEIPDRQSRRAAERINMKERAAAKKEYTTLVVELSELVMRRDPRVAAERQRVAEEEAAKEELRQQKELVAARRRRDANEKIWAEGAEKERREEQEREERGDLADGEVLELLYEKQRQMEARRKAGKQPVVGRADDALLEEDRGLQIQESKFACEDESQEVQQPLLQCAACKKSFGTNQKQWNEHIGSAKHKTKLKQLAAKGVDVVVLMGGAPAPEPSGVAVAPSTAAASDRPRSPERKHGKPALSKAPQQQESSESEEDVPIVARNAFGVFGHKKRK